MNTPLEPDIDHDEGARRARLKENARLAEHRGRLDALSASIAYSVTAPGAASTLLQAAEALSSGESTPDSANDPLPWLIRRFIATGLLPAWMVEFDRGKLRLNARAARAIATYLRRRAEDDLALRRELVDAAEALTGPPPPAMDHVDALDAGLPPRPATLDRP